jgi:hypothetical protein
MTRVMRLTLLAPDIVEAILDGRQGPGVTLARVLEPFWRIGRIRMIPFADASQRCYRKFQRQKARWWSQGESNP